MKDTAIAELNQAYEESMQKLNDANRVLTDSSSSGQERQAALLLRTFMEVVKDVYQSGSSKILNDKDTIQSQINQVSALSRFTDEAVKHVLTATQ